MMERKKYLARPIQQNDFNTICDFTKQVGSGFTSLPNDPKIIERKIQRSLESFALKNDPNARFFFFVLEDLSDHSVVGTSAIEAQLTYQTPYHCFKVSTLLQECPSLKIRKKHSLLMPVNNYQDASLFCTLFIGAQHRGQGQGEFLSRIRGLFISLFPTFFSDLIVAEMRGIFNEKGVSPFWEGVGLHFFGMDFPTANYLGATRGNQFIADLAPAHPIYSGLLSAETQAVIGQCHEKTKPAQHVLEKEGFCFRNNVDLFDAGPILEILKKDLKTVKESQEVTVIGIKSKLKNPIVSMISKLDLDFRATLGSLELMTSHEVCLENETAHILQVAEGDRIRFCPF